MTLKLSTLSTTLYFITSKAVIRLWCRFCCHGYTKVVGIGSLRIESYYHWHENPEYISAIHHQLLLYVLWSSIFLLLSSLYFLPPWALWLSFELLSVSVQEKLQRELQDCHVAGNTLAHDRWYRISSRMVVVREPKWLSASMAWSPFIPDVNSLCPFNSTCLFFFVAGVPKAQIRFQPLLASIPCLLDETQLISIRIALLITPFVTPDKSTKNQKTFNFLFINGLTAPVPPLSNDVCLKVLA